MTKSLMSKKLIKFLPPKWIVGKITHEAIIDKHIFEFAKKWTISKVVPFKKRFSQMVAISLGVTIIYFVIGYIVKHVCGLDD